MHLPKRLTRFIDVVEKVQRSLLNDHRHSSILSYPTNRFGILYTHACTHSKHSLTFKHNIHIDICVQYAAFTRPSMHNIHHFAHTAVISIYPSSQCHSSTLPFMNALRNQQSWSYFIWMSSTYFSKFGSKGNISWYCFFYCWLVTNDFLWVK